MKRTLTLLTIALLMTMPIVAQVNFVKATVYTSRKDTINGYIDYQEWAQSPKKITFKKGIEQASETLTPATIAAFVVNNERFETLDFVIEKLPRDFNTNLFGTIGQYANRKKDERTITAFARVLSSGKITLYRFEDSEVGEHFMVKKNEKLEPLVYHVAMIGANISYLNQYQNQLQLLLKDACKPLSTDNLTYKTNALSTLIDLYNGCFSASVPANIQPKKKGKLEVGALLGVNISTLNYSRYDNTSSINTEDDWKVTPTAGVFINFVAPRLQGRLALQNEVLYYNRQRTFTLDEVTYKSLYTYDFSYIGLNNILRYSVLTTQPSLYVLAGFSNGFVVRGKTYLQKVGFGNSDKVSFDGQYRKHEQALIVGIGTQIKRFSIEARYLRGNGFSAFVSTRSLTKSTSCVLKYHFY